MKYKNLSINFVISYCYWITNSFYGQSDSYFNKESKNVKSYSTNFVGRPKDKLKYKTYINIENKLNSFFLFLKRKKIVNDNFASKILNIFKNF